jgi:DNA polymerase III delta prime subunit
LDEISFQEETVAAFKGILNTGDVSLNPISLNLPSKIATTLIALRTTGYRKNFNYSSLSQGALWVTLASLQKEKTKPNPREKFYRQRIMEMNASDDRGIQKVREKVKRYSGIVCAKNPDKTIKCPNYKIIILDEADHMTIDAQTALRRIIEDFSRQTRFVIICNYITKYPSPN